MSSQPLDQVYQNPVLTSQPNPSHSNDSFGPVFIVLAVIIVISAFACVLGRLGSKRYEGSYKQSKAGKQSQGLGHKEWESRQKSSYNTRDGDIEFPKEWESRQKPSYKRDGDVEFGFEKKMSSKGDKNGGGNSKPMHYNDGAHRPDQDRFVDNHYNNGAHRPDQVRFGDNHYNNGAHRPDQVRFADNHYNNGGHRPNQVGFADNVYY